MKKILYLLIALFFFTTATVNADVIDGRFYPVINSSIDSQKSINNLYGQINHKIKIVFSDIDGTIVPFNPNTPKWYIPQSAKIAAGKLRNADIPLILVTGRSTFDGRSYAKRIGNPNSYVVSQQGAEISNPQGKIIYQDAIKNKDAVNIIANIEKFNVDNKKSLSIFVYANGNLYMTDNLGIPYINDKITVLKSFKDLPIDYTPVKIGIYDKSNDDLVLVQKYLKKKYRSYHIDISAHCYCDISKKTATKGNAIAKLSELLNVDLQSAATFGDAENDISMLKLLKKKHGVAIAVGNAMPAVKQYANYVTLPALEGGFAKGIDEILKNNSRLDNSKY